MSETNGIIRIGTKGRKQFAFGDDEPFTVDVIDVSNRWAAIDSEFRQLDSNGQLVVPPAQMLPLNDACWNFVREISGCGNISKAEAIEFMKHITDEANALQDFFSPKSVEKKPSSQESTATSRFST